MADPTDNTEQPPSSGQTTQPAARNPQEDSPNTSMRILIGLVGGFMIFIVAIWFFALSSWGGGTNESQVQTDGVNPDISQEDRRIDTAPENLPSRSYREEQVEEQKNRAEEAAREGEVALSGALPDEYRRTEANFDTGPPTDRPPQDVNPSQNLGESPTDQQGGSSRTENNQSDQPVGTPDESDNQDQSINQQDQTDTTPSPEPSRPADQFRAISKDHYEAQAASFKQLTDGGDGPVGGHSVTSVSSGQPTSGLRGSSGTNQSTPNGSNEISSGLTGTQEGTGTASNQGGRVLEGLNKGGFMYATNNLQLNSDEPSQALATVTSCRTDGDVCPYTDWKLMGEFERTGTNLVLRFTSLTDPESGRSYTMNGVAVDPDREMARVRSDVNTRFYSKLAANFATSFLAGFAEGTKQGGDLLLGTNGAVTGAQSTKDLTAEDELIAGVGQAAEDLQKQVQEYQARPPTVRLEPGTPMKVLIIDPPKK